MSKLKCDICKQTDKGRYQGREVNGKWITACNECWYGRNSGTGKTDKKIFDELQTPFWKLMGLEPKAKDIALDKYLKNRGMSYSDWRRERDAGARFGSALNQFEQHYNKYGRNNAPEPQHKKG